MTTNLRPTWAPRVPQHLIRQLYENDAAGMVDEALLDEVGWRLVARCKSFIEAVEATHGLVRCPRCSTVIHRVFTPDEWLSCPTCDWELSWKQFFSSIQHHQLSGAQPVTDLFNQFIDHFQRARTYQAKMLLIDHLIHAFHINLREGCSTRTTGVNLIEGRYHEVVAFLDGLSYGSFTTPGLLESLVDWRSKIHAGNHRLPDGQG